MTIKLSSKHKKVIGIVVGVVVASIIVLVVILLSVLGGEGAFTTKLPFYPELKVARMKCSKCSFTLDGLSVKYEVEATVWVSIKNTLKKTIKIKGFKGDISWDNNPLGSTSHKNMCGDRTLPLTVAGRGGTEEMCVDFKGSMSVSLNAFSALSAYCNNEMKVKVDGSASVQFGKLKNLQAPLSYLIDVKPQACSCDIASILC